MSSKKLTRHHMIPSSRGGSDANWNIKMVSDKEHTAWHLLFSNKTPAEILDYIEREWFPRRK